MRSKKSPKYFLKLSANNGKPNSVITEDLTEITITDVISDPSDTFRSVGHTDNPFLKLNPVHISINSKNEIMYDTNFLLLAPDNSYTNAVKFNQRLGQKSIGDENVNPFNNNTNNKSINFPMLQIDTSDDRPLHYSHFNKSEAAPLPKMLFDDVLRHDNNNNIVYNPDLLVSPDLIMRDRLRKKGRPASPKRRPNQDANRERSKSLFIRQNLLQVDDLDKSLDSLYLPMNRSVKAPQQTNRVSTSVHSLSKELENHSLLDDRTMDDKTMDVITDTEVVIHHGYIITDGNGRLGPLND